MADAGQEIRQVAGRNQNVKSIKIPQGMEDRIFSRKSVAIYEKWHQKFINFISEKDLPENLESIVRFSTKSPVLIRLPHYGNVIVV